MVIKTTPGGIRLILLIAGLLALACSSALAAAAKRRGGPWPTRVRELGAAGAVVGWLLFWALPTHHGQLPAPVLLIVAIAYPMIAVESGRGLALRAFSWAALLLFVAGCAVGVVLPTGSWTVALQEGLLALGVIVPPVVGLLSVPTRWGYHRLRSGRRRGRARTSPFGENGS
jgi:hypothetical protein